MRVRASRALSVYPAVLGIFSNSPLADSDGKPSRKLGHPNVTAAIHRSTLIGEPRLLAALIALGKRI
jgi:hypothetical protein